LSFDSDVDFFNAKIDNDGVDFKKAKAESIFDDLIKRVD